MARTKKTKTTIIEKRELVSTVSAGTGKCVDCGATYPKTKCTYSDGYEVVTPTHGRCNRCQDIYLLNLRFDKFKTACKHLSAMAKRMTEEERTVITDLATTEFKKVLSAMAQTVEEKKVATKFDIRQYIR